MRSAHLQDHYETFRATLIAARKGAGLTQAQLASKLNRPQSFVAKVENGERRLDVVEFTEYAEAIEVAPIVLFKRILKLWQGHDVGTTAPSSPRAR
ncbi:MAG: helix-turn-helix transcriptional regulator [Phreatobacter sp.]|uniref:helix-turn-helix domain-containing protein n=1 Tax=Phreatobacter sp. TaxID=1966341 RepID=UPI001A43CF34|nr:helix-turn-helix transcriptional regulator [Phreatobacter sp.]MBL8571964.1 helix-turn-helix transcriptional regulator [Phreatobacter sp.]